MTSWTLYRSSAMRTRRTFISVRLSSPKMIRTTATTTFSNASSCSLFILLFRFLLPDNLVTFSVPVSLRLGAELSGVRAWEKLVARGLAADVMLGMATGGAALSVGGGGAVVSFPLPFLAGLMETAGADLRTGGGGLTKGGAGFGAGGAGLSTTSGAVLGRG